MRLRRKLVVLISVGAIASILGAPKAAVAMQRFDAADAVRPVKTPSMADPSTD
jgi:hypothetical protein